MKVVKGQFCDFCNKAAFYWKEVPKLSETINASLVFNKEDFKQPIPSGQPFCQWCGELFRMSRMKPLYLGDFDYETGKEVLRNLKSA